jgi:glutamate 5-kinase
LTVLLTTVDGLRRTVDGRFAERIPLVEALTDEMRNMAGGTDGNVFSTGGMTSKLRAADVCMTAGESLWIADGTDFGVLHQILAAEDVGTLFVPGATRLSGSKRWLAFFTEPAGRVTIDSGAARALRRAGRSLLPSGVVAADGAFGKGDTVQILAPDGSQVGMGISNYTAAEVKLIKGRRSHEIAGVLGKQAYDEVIHRDNLVLLDRPVVP